MNMLETKAIEHFNEERRLQLVAVTRAREQAFITYVRVDWQKEPIEPSPFLARLEPLCKITRFPTTDVELDAEENPRYRYPR